MLVIGIDVGLDGALSALDAVTGRVVAMLSMPTIRVSKTSGKRRELSEALLVDAVHDALGDRLVTHCFIERVSGVSGPRVKGQSSGFSFGWSYGGARMLAAALGWPSTYVTPQTWKKTLGVPADKEDAVARACQLMPQDVVYWTPKRDHFNKAQASGRAESALIALWGIRHLQGR